MIAKLLQPSNLLHCFKLFYQQIIEYQLIYPICIMSSHLQAVKIYFSWKNITANWIPYEAGVLFCVIIQILPPVIWDFFLFFMLDGYVYICWGGAGHFLSQLLPSSTAHLFQCNYYNHRWVHTYKCTKTTRNWTTSHI